MAIEDDATVGELIAAAVEQLKTRRAGEPVPSGEGSIVFGLDVVGAGTVLGTLVPEFATEARLVFRDPQGGREKDPLKLSAQNVEDVLLAVGSFAYVTGRAGDKGRLAKATQAPAVRRDKGHVYIIFAPTEEQENKKKLPAGDPIIVPKKCAAYLFPTVAPLEEAFENPVILRVGLQEPDHPVGYVAGNITKGSDPLVHDLLHAWAGALEDTPDVGTLPWFRRVAGDMLRRLMELAKAPGGAGTAVDPSVLLRGTEHTLEMHKTAHRAALVMSHLGAVHLQRMLSSVAALGWLCDAYTWAAGVARAAGVAKWIERNIVSHAALTTLLGDDVASTWGPATVRGGAGLSLWVQAKTALESIVNARMRRLRRHLSAAWAEYDPALSPADAGILAGEAAPDAATWEATWKGYAGMNSSLLNMLQIDFPLVAMLVLNVSFPPGRKPAPPLEINERHIAAVFKAAEPEAGSVLASRITAGGRHNLFEGAGELADALNAYVAAAENLPKVASPKVALPEGALPEVAWPGVPLPGAASPKVAYLVFGRAGGGPSRA